jgi:hypothetical protein
VRVRPGKHGEPGELLLLFCTETQPVPAVALLVSMLADALPYHTAVFLSVEESRASWFYAASMEILAQAHGELGFAL